MKQSAVMLGIASLICGLTSAWYWYKVRKILFEPKFSEPADQLDVLWAVTRAIMIAVTWAALWTAAAVVLGGASGLLIALASN
jgi:ABC-type transporter Mla maintaining outer membrane lipid asymmetry permease subunit MlaE